MILTQLGYRSLILGMIWEWIVHNPHFRLGLGRIELGDNLGHLVPIDLSCIVQIIDVIMEVVTIVNCVARSMMEWVVFGLI